MLEAKKLTYFIMVNLRFSDECSYSGEVGTLISAVRFFPTGALISAVRFFPTVALIRGGALNRILRVA